MKKSLVALAALAVAGAASAQSSVTLFGIVDTGVSYYQTTSNLVPNAAYALANPLAYYGVSDTSKQNKWALSSGNESMSRLGFRGTEDLGGGLAASFWLESQLGSDEGNAGVDGRFFNRRSTVSLSGGFGEVRLGRDYTPTYWNYTVFDPFGTVGVGGNVMNSFMNTWDDNSNFTRRSNTVGYFLPANLGGFYGQLQYSFSEKIGYDPGDTTPRSALTGDYDSRSGRYIGGRVGYANGPLDVALAYGSGVSDSAYYAGLTNTVDNWTLGASYDFSVVKLFAQYSQAKSKLDSDGIILPRSFDGKANGYLVGVSVPVGPGLIKAAYSHIDLREDSWATPVTINGLTYWQDADKAKADKFSLGYVHNLSKRTALYATFAYIKNKNGMNMTTGGGLGYPAVNPAGVYNPVSGQYVPGSYVADKSYGYDFGIRHSF